MIKAIFYSKFDVHEGPKVVHQVPINSITSSSNSSSPPLLHWPSVSSTIIPRQTFCSLPLTLLAHPYRVLSHPICLASPTYPRNEFIFSFSLVLHHRTPAPAYASVVSKLAALFRHLEESSHFLSRDASPPNTGKIYALCEILLQDLNHYCEAMVPIDGSNTLNVKLFPTYPPPPPLQPQHVPLATVRLSALTDPNWDLTLLRILPFVDGINSVRAIATLADADYKLVRKAVAHLLYYGCVVLLDLFTFGASYAPTAEIGTLVASREMQDECRRYVLVPERGGPEEIDGARLAELYCSLKQGLSMRNWCMDHAGLMGVIDVRRFITFGVVKGFLYRVHKYAMSIEADGPGDAMAERNGLRQGSAELLRYLDGTHCFDEICTELMISEKELLGRLNAIGDVQIIQR